MIIIRVLNHRYLIIFLTGGRCLQVSSSLQDSLQYSGWFLIIGTAKSIIRQFLFYLLTITWFGLLFLFTLFEFFLSPPVPEGFWLATQSIGHTLVSCVWFGCGSGRVWLVDWWSPPALRGHPPGFQPLRWRVLSGSWGVPNKGNADGAIGIFRKCKARAGSGPAPGHT